LKKTRVLEMAAMIVLEFMTMEPGKAFEVAESVPSPS
jgi:hypothetical protein